MNNDMELINKYSRRQLNEDEVYTFSVVLCDNDIDRDIEHFDDAALDKLKELFVGVSAVYDHEPSAKNQVARIYSCSCEDVPGRKTAYRTQYRRLVGKAYVPICERQGYAPFGVQPRQGQALRRENLLLCIE